MFKTTPLVEWVLFSKILDVLYYLNVLHDEKKGAILLTKPLKRKRLVEISHEIIISDFNDNNLHTIYLFLNNSTTYVKAIVFKFLFVLYSRYL